MTHYVRAVRKQTYDARGRVTQTGALMIPRPDREQAITEATRIRDGLFGSNFSHIVVVSMETQETVFVAKALGREVPA